MWLVTHDHDQELSATAVATTHAAKMDPYQDGGDGPVVEDPDAASDDNEDERKLEAKRKAKRERMKFNRSLESVLDEIISCNKNSGSSI